MQASGLNNVVLSILFIIYVTACIVTGTTQYFNKIQKNSNSEQHFKCFNESTFRLGCSHHQDHFCMYCYLQYTRMTIVILRCGYEDETDEIFYL